ncbi:PCMD domain-containing protein [Dysgonomonas sp. Marseille-P4361]|uniref:PCMD domain-containing protein n=1 Tax=Dysgonomonas sp. Marseille-P4361 TaxID=2161820 RepID=UPI0021019015|nr:PCMD domain-containing protein [Dysgonomonas sp. Marseille-P4361]
MKLKLLFLISTLLLSLSSCIQDEPLGREADIVDMKVEGEHFVTRAISDNSIQLIVSDKADYTQLVPIITVSPGAIITPASGIAQDFSNDKRVTYVVTSENGEYSKTYSVTATPKISLKHSFEDWSTSGNGKGTYPILDDLLWSNANSAISILVATEAIKVDNYPTDKTSDCVEGEWAAALETVKGTTVIGKYYPIFAGSLFRGGFIVDMDYPTKSLRLGQSHPKENGKPIYFNGYYKYTPGKEFTDRDGKIVANRTDSMSIYATLFKVSKGAAPTEQYLDGETIMNSSRVVGRATWSANSENILETDAENGFTRFVIPFEYTEDLNFEENDYRLTIVSSSSKGGDFYEGAVGSRLIIDEFEIICDPIK